MGRVQDDVAAELDRARDLFPPFHTPHEGYAILLEEMDELKAEVWAYKSTAPARIQELSRQRMRTEAIQIAAMAMRFVEDLT